MKINRTLNTKRNIFWGIINKIITLLLPFLTRTVMIRTLGADYLGLNSLFSSILQVLNLTELGFSSAIVYSMYKPIAENDNESICALLNEYRIIYKVVGGIILLVGFILVPFLPKLIHGNVPSNINIYFVYFIYLFNTAISYLLFAYKQAIPNAFQRNDIISNITSISMGGLYLLQIIILLQINQYYPYLILMPVSTIVNNILTSVYVDKTYPEYKCRGRISAKQRAEIKEKVLGLFINKVCATTRNSLDSICISAFLGLTITAMYNNYYYVISALMGLFTVITSSMTAGIGNSMVIETVDKNYNDLKKINFVYMWISGWAAICMLILYQPFISICFGKQYLFPFSVVLELCLYFYVLKMGDIRSIYSDGAGLWWENRYRAIAESIANILLNIVLGKIWGVHGIILATLISLFVINFIFGSQIVFKYYFKNRKIGEYFAYHSFYFLVTFILGLVTFYVCHLIVADKITIGSIVIKVIICFLIPNLLYFLIYKKTKVYREAIPWILGKYNLQKKLSFFMPRER